MADATIQLTASNEQDHFSVENSNEILKPQTTSAKLFSFLQRYFKQVKLVFQSIRTDFRSFQTWQIVILIIYATFNATFTIVVR